MIKVTYDYYISGVKELSTKKDSIPFTAFTIKDTVKDGSKFKHTWWNCITFDEVKLIDGAKVKITGIDSITAREFNDKLYNSLTVSVQAVEDEPN